MGSVVAALGAQRKRSLSPEPVLSTRARSQLVGTRSWTRSWQRVPRSWDTSAPHSRSAASTARPTQNRSCPQHLRFLSLPHPGAVHIPLSLSMSMSLSLSLLSTPFHPCSQHNKSSSSSPSFKQTCPGCWKDLGRILKRYY